MIAQSSRLTLASSILIYLLGDRLTPPAQAHENHDHAKDTDSAAPPAAESPVAPSSDTPEVGSTPAQDTHPIETVASPPPDVSTTQARLIRPEAMGLGELMLGTIIAGPFLLRSFKKRLQS